MASDTSTDTQFQTLLEYLKNTRGFDFSGYKSASLQRRIQKRMEIVNLKDYSDYTDYLEVHPDEFVFLFNTILINVTSFFRDEAPWQYLADEVIPKIVANKAGKGIRIWDVGCASGQEAYSVAMLFCEALGTQKFQDQVKIYATDVDEEALLEARQAVYSEQAMQSVSQALREKYFTLAANRYSFRSELRRCVIFGRHDLVQDAPISHLDLLVCRNTLMYLNSQTQGRILSGFHYALENDGFLFLGKSEMLLSHLSLFQPLDMKNRIFKKATKISGRDRMLAVAHRIQSDPIDTGEDHLRMRELSFDASLVPQIVIDSAGVLALANQRARHLFSLEEDDIGRPLQDLEISYRPVELRSLIDRAYEQKSNVHVKKVARQLKNGGSQFLDLEVALLSGPDGELIGTSVTFTDVTGFQQIYDELQKANQELEFTNVELSSAHEELETTNEELQSTNEELETTNEELQSTNEELETMNEELQSTSEELETTNHGLRKLTQKLNNTNSFLSSILASLSSAVVVIDRQFNIIVWNQRAENLWGLRGEEVVDHSLLSLDIGLPVASLKEPVLKFFRDQSTYEELQLDAVNRTGKSIVCKIRMTPLHTHGNAHETGVVISMDELEA